MYNINFISLLMYINDKTMMYMNPLYTCSGLTEPCFFVTRSLPVISVECNDFDHSQNSLSLKVYFVLKLPDR